MQVFMMVIIATDKIITYHDHHKNLCPHVNKKAATIIMIAASIYQNILVLVIVLHGNQLIRSYCLLFWLCLPFCPVK